MHLSTADHHSVGLRPWLTIQAARWLSSTSARTANEARRCPLRSLANAIFVLTIGVANTLPKTADAPFL